MPPYDGELPRREFTYTVQPNTPAPARPTSALDLIRAERKRNADEMESLETRFKALKSANAKLDHALEVLAAP